MWDFRNLIRRAGGSWPRDWRQILRKPIPPPRPPRPAEPEGRLPDREPDEHWLPPGWKPGGTPDDWRNADP